MGKIKRPDKVKLFIGVIFSKRAILDRLKKKLTKKFGPIDVESKIIPFNFTDYYEKETGPNLKKIFYSFEKPIIPDLLAKIKILTNGMENQLAKKYRNFPRPANLDPGYLTLSNVVLATTKDQAHRIYLGQGIYAEVTLLYQKKKFISLSWTYPDYRTSTYHQFFQKAREKFILYLTK
jgi:hypothetical protein